METTLFQNVQSIIQEDIRLSAMQRQSKAIFMVKAIQFLNAPQSPFLFQVATLSGVFIFCWSAYAVLSIASIFGFAELIPLSFTVIPLQFAKTSILWNAIILVIMNPMVRNKVQINLIISD